MSGDSKAWPTYRRLLGFARPYRTMLLLALGAMLVEAAAGSAFMKLMEPVVNETFISRNRPRVDRQSRRPYLTVVYLLPGSEVRVFGAAGIE